MNAHRVSSFSELHHVLSRFRRSNRWLYRGHANPNWILVPRAGRPPYSDVDDLALLKAWKRRAIEYVSNAPDNDWDWLAIAQHHGLATRLLDWSFNPLVAAYFACRHGQDSDANIFCFKPKRYLNPDETTPAAYKKVSVFKPKGVVPRITRQGGVFTAHGQPKLPLEETLTEKDKLEVIVIDRVYVKELMFDLNHYGINAAYVFPDLDGLSRHVNWYMENQDYWGRSEATPEDI